MSEENKERSTWDELVGELGVNVTDDALERRQPAPKELPSRRREKIDREETAACPSDWEGLASSLGIEVPRVVEQPPVQQPAKDRAEKATSKSSEEVAFEAEEIQAEVEVGQERVDSSEFIEQSDAVEDDVSETPRISGEAARSAFDALFAADAASWGSAFVSPRTNVESSFLFTEGEEAVFAEEIPDDATDDEEEPKRGRRRRRRGGRGRGRGKSDAGAEGESIELKDAETKESAESSTEESAEADVDSSEEAAPLEKRRRRRRSRGRSKQKDSQELSAEEDSRIKQHVASHVGDDEDDDDADNLSYDDEESSSTGGSRTSHRNLPTWDEAIGVIVDTNLAQRSKSPPKQSSGSSRGRNRGGRRHKKS